MLTIVYSDQFLHHETGYMHPEQPDRLTAIVELLKASASLIVSAGYDANQADLLSRINLQPSDYAALTQYSLDITPKVLFGLEGGYDLESLSLSVFETVKQCLITQQG